MFRRSKGAQTIVHFRKDAALQFERKSMAGGPDLRITSLCLNCVNFSPSLPADDPAWRAGSAAQSAD